MLKWRWGSQSWVLDGYQNSRPSSRQSSYLGGGASGSAFGESVSDFACVDQIPRHFELSWFGEKFNGANSQHSSYS